MQVRLKVQRVAVAVQLALADFEPETFKSEAAHEAEIARQVAILCAKKTWCGGFKYNEERARRIVVNGSGMFDEYLLGEGGLPTYKQFKRDREKWNRLVTLDNMFREKSGFMVWLDESDYRMIERFI